MVANKTNFQKIMKELRYFMDNSSKQYINKKNNIDTIDDKLKRQVNTNIANINYIEKNKIDSNVN